MMQAITKAATEAAKAAIMAVKEAENPVDVARSIQVMPKAGGPAQNSQHSTGKQHTNA